MTPGVCFGCCDRGLGSFPPAATAGPRWREFAFGREGCMHPSRRFVPFLAHSPGRCAYSGNHTVGGEPSQGHPVPGCREVHGSAAGPRGSASVRHRRGTKTHTTTIFFVICHWIPVPEGHRAPWVCVRSGIRLRSPGDRASEGSLWLHRAEKENPVRRQLIAAQH